MSMVIEIANCFASSNVIGGGVGVGVGVGSNTKDTQSKKHKPDIYMNA